MPEIITFTDRTVKLDTGAEIGHLHLQRNYRCADCEGTISFPWDPQRRVIYPACKCGECRRVISLAAIREMEVQAVEIFIQLPRDVQRRLEVRVSVKSSDAEADAKLLFG